MILSDTDLHFLNSHVELVSRNKTSLISPWDDSAVQPASIDLRLGPHFCTEFRDNGFQQNFTRFYSDTTYILPSRKTVLAITKERVYVPNGYSARVEGKSSLGRAGVLVHITAGFVDPGWYGNLTLELYNLNDWEVPLKIGMKICQIVYFKNTSESVKAYGADGLGSKYQGDTMPTPSQYKWMK